jgi:hypothetical protein
MSETFHDNNADAKASIGSGDFVPEVSIQIFMHLTSLSQTPSLCLGSTGYTTFRVFQMESPTIAMQEFRLRLSMSVIEQLPLQKD